MARISWPQEFIALLARAGLSTRNRAVVEDMQRGYKLKGAAYMTRGRRNYLEAIKRQADQAEKSASEPPSATSLRLDRLRARMADGATWNHDFVTSLAEQARRGATLSARQIEVLETIEANYTDEKCAMRAAFVVDYQNDKNGVKTDFNRLMLYYKSNLPWYSGIVAQWKQAGESFVPVYDDHAMITRSEYAKKVLEGYKTPAKYAVGSLVYPRKPWTGPGSEAFIRGAIVIKNTGIITSACKGNRVYTVLPIGASEVRLCEERYLKASKKR